MEDLSQWIFVTLIGIFLSSSIARGISHKHNDDNVFIDSESAQIKQSNECTAYEIENNIQCFQEIPKTEYEVAQGSTATLPCVVRNQHGKVQWRAVPVLLGYDRNIPGRPRYRYVGSAVKGEHHLEIRDVTKEDAGCFECQVQPVGDRHPLLRRKTELIVLIRPSEPHIFYRSVKPHNDRVIINSLNPEVRSEFLCISLNGSPAPTFKWFINNNAVTNDYSATLELVQATRSKMNYLTKNLKDSDMIRCRVSNKATVKHHDPAKQYMDKEIEVVIHTPPGRPTIVEMTQSQGSAYTEGDVLRGSCISKPPGKPEGSIVWRWKMPKSRELYNHQREDFTVKDISPQYYQQMISRNQLISKIELPPLSSQFHGAQLLCVAINPVTSYQSSLVNILIKYPPKEVKISTLDGSLMTRPMGNDGLTESIIFGESGEQKSITCTTSTYYSEAQIKWQMHYNPSTEDFFPKNVSFGPTEKVWKEGFSYRRNSTIKVTIDRRYDKSYLDCQAWSDGKRVDSRVKLDITYPPEKPIISGYHNDRPVKLNHIIELSCSTIGGNPFPELRWFRDNIPLDNAHAAQQIGNQKSINLSVSPSKADNNAKYFCQAKSVSLKNAPLNSEEIRLIVLFPPTIITMSSMSGTEVDDGDILTLQCLVDESNPPAIVRWKINRCGQMMMELGRRAVQKNCEEEVLTSPSSKLMSGNFGGKKLKSNIEIRTTWKDHMDYVDCEAYNPDYKDDRQVLRKRIQLNITFSPKFVEILSRNIVIEEYQSKTYTVDPIANPPIYRYTWLKDSSELGPITRSVSGSKSKLVINKVSTADSGNYTLVVTNDRGEASISFNLNVTYRPIILGDAFEKIVNNRQNADLECSVRANPANPYQAYRWIKLIPKGGFNDISNSGLTQAFSIGCNQAEWKGTPEKSNFKYFSKCSTRSQYEMNSLLVVYDVDRNDVGIYKCIINNGVGNEITKTIELIKYFTPQILALPKYSKAAGSQGETVTIVCYIRAEPQPKISWFFGKYNFSITANSKYRLDMSRIRPGLYVTQLKLNDIQRSDHGKYFCKAENEKGSDMRSIDVSGTSKPDIPMEVQVMNKTLTSITISWVQGFDGGSVQTFQVRWKEKIANSLFRYEDVASDDSKTALDFIINGLKADTIYYVSINSRNTKHGKSLFSTDIEAPTLSSISEVDPNQVGFRPTAEDNKLQDNTVLFIVAASVFGFVILVVNVLVIIFVLRRRRQRSRTAKMEARYKNPKSLLAASNGLILSSDDHLRDSNSNFLRGDAVELYPRGLDTSQMSNHPHHLHSLRCSIPDDQKTFSSIETGSDDAREDLLRRQQEFGCCSLDANNQKGSIILAYDPVTNSSYYAPISSTSSTPMYLQAGMYDQDTLSTLLSPIHEDSQRHLMTYMNMIPYSGQRDSSSCGSINSGGTQPPGHYVLNNISPCSSITAQDPRSFSSNDNINSHTRVDDGSFPSSGNNNAPYRTRVVSPTFLGYGLTAQQRDSYASELRKAQLAGNIIVNPVMFSRHSTNNSQVVMNPGSLLSSPINNTGRQFIPTSFESFSRPQLPSSVQHDELQLNSSNVDSQFCQKYQCTDNQNRSNQSTENNNRAIEFVNSALDDSTHLDHDSQYLPRPDLI